MKKYKKYTFHQFVNDSDFIAWVQHSNEESNKYWNEVIKQNPWQKDTIREAILFIQSLQAIEPAIEDQKFDKIWNNLLVQKKTRRMRTQVFRWAAVFFLVVSVSLVAPRIHRSLNNKIAKVEIANLEEAKVILSDGTVKSFTEKDSEIELVSSKEIIVNQDTLKNTHKTNEENLIQVVIPFGKHSSLKLPDGTTVYVNAGSQITFPAAFSGDKRVVSLIGEAFFDVKKDATHPFVVHTNDMDITVTGTEFNVSAYYDDEYTQAVLVSGVVNVSKPKLLSKNIQIEPGESAIITKEEGEIITSRVNPEKFTSWINGYIICENDPVSEVMKKVERYYNRRIQVSSEVGPISFSGKLDLDNNLEVLLQSLAEIYSLQIEIKNETILIKKES